MNLSERLKQMTQEIQEEKGYCLLQDRHYGAISGVRVHNTTKKASKVSLYWRLNFEESGIVFQILNGVTGSEAWYLEDVLKFLDPKEPFICACAGTKGKWDTLHVSTKDLIELINKYNWRKLCP